MSGEIEGDDGNPFAAPEADLSGGERIPWTEAEAVRYAHLGAENWIQAVGMLVLIGGISSCAIGARILLLANRRTGIDSLAPLMFFTVGVLGLIVGSGLRKYDPSARLLMFVGLALWGIMVVLGIMTRGLPLLAPIAIWAPIVGGVLYALLNPRARAIFRPEYREIIAQTPHIVPNSGCLANAVGFGLIVLAGAVVAACSVIFGR